MPHTCSVVFGWIAFGLPAANGGNLRRTLIPVHLSSDDPEFIAKANASQIRRRDSAAVTATLVEAMASVADGHDLPSLMWKQMSQLNSSDLSAVATNERVQWHPLFAAIPSFTHNETPEEALRQITGAIERPLMNSINIMRIEFCLKRPDLLSHEKCLKFLLEMCLKQSSGYGYCVEFEEDLEPPCKRDEKLPGESRPCEMHDQLRAAMHPDDVEKPKPEEHPVAPPSTPPLPHVTPVSHHDSHVPPEGAGRVAAAPAAVLPASPGAPAAPALPTNLDKTVREPGLPVQGYDEHSDIKVMHRNLDTQTADWRSEWPSWGESEDQSTDRICQENPDHLWCRLWLKDRGHGANQADRAKGFGESNLMKSVHATGDQADEAADRTEDTLDEATDRTADSLPEGSQSNLTKSIHATGDQADEAADGTVDSLPEGSHSNLTKSIHATGDQADEAADRIADSLPA